MFLGFAYYKFLYLHLFCCLQFTNLWTIDSCFLIFLQDLINLSCPMTNNRWPISSILLISASVLKMIREYISKKKNITIGHFYKPLAKYYFYGEISSAQGLRLLTRVAKLNNSHECKHRGIGLTLLKNTRQGPWLVDL
jgi:hypothetical protein